MGSAQITPLKWTLTLGLLVSLVLISALFWKKMSGDGVATPVAPEGGNVVADFTLPDLNGQPVRFSEFVAGRPAVVSFGTTSCPFCVLQLKAFRELRDQLGDKVALLEVNVGERAAVVAAHVQRVQSPIKTLLDMNGSVFSRYGSQAVPVTVVADASGRILQVGNYIPASRIAELLRLGSAKAQAG